MIARIASINDTYKLPHFKVEIIKANPTAYTAIMLWKQTYTRKGRQPSSTPFSLLYIRKEKPSSYGMSTFRQLSSQSIKQPNLEHKRQGHLH